MFPGMFGSIDVVSDEGRQVARTEFRQQMHAQEMSLADVSRRAKVDAKTVRAFLDGSRWPQQATRWKLCRAVDWHYDQIDQIEFTGEPPEPGRVTILTEDWRSLGDAAITPERLSVLYAEVVRYYKTIAAILPESAEATAQGTFAASQLYGHAYAALNRQRHGGTGAASD